MKSSWVVSYAHATLSSDLSACSSVITFSGRSSSTQSPSATQNTNSFTSLSPSLWLRRNQVPSQRRLILLRSCRYASCMSPEWTTDHSRCKCRTKDVMASLTWPWCSRLSTMSTSSLHCSTSKMIIHSTGLSPRRIKTGSNLVSTLWRSPRVRIRIATLI